MTAEFDRLFVLVVGLVFAAYLTRCCVGALLLWASHLPGRLGRTCLSAGDLLTPRLARRAAAALVGTAAATTGIAPAMAASPPSPDSATQRHAVNVPEIDRGPLAKTSGTDHSGKEAGRERPTSTKGAPGNETPHKTHRTSTVKVKPGDCLWTLAAGQLSPAASSRQIARETNRWFEANKTAIGSDPNLIVTGTILSIPGRTR